MHKRCSGDSRKWQGGPAGAHARGPGWACSDPTAAPRPTAVSGGNQGVRGGHTGPSSSPWDTVRPSPRRCGLPGAPRDTRPDGPRVAEEGGGAGQGASPVLAVAPRCWGVRDGRRPHPSRWPPCWAQPACRQAAAALGQRGIWEEVPWQHSLVGPCP